MASAGSLRRSAAPLLDPAHQRGLTSLLSQTYGKPVQLNFTKLRQPHHDADILSQHVTQKLVDRKANVRRVLRDAAWKAHLPTQNDISLLQQQRQHRASTKQPLTLADLTHKPEGVESVLRDLNLPQVSSVRVQASGRLTKRISADMALTKVARRGATDKGAAPLLRGFQKNNVTYARRAGKKRIGSFGVKVHVGHS